MTDLIAPTSLPARRDAAGRIVVLLLLGALTGMTACAGSAHAALVFYDNSPADFTTAASAFTHLGTEDFEEPSLAALPNNSAATFLGPLSQTSTTAPYTSGIALPMTVRTVDPADNTPEQLVAFRNHMTISSTVVLANTSGDTLDWVFEPSSNIIAVGLNPVTFSGSNLTRQMTVDVFDTNDSPLGSITIDSNDAGSRHLGMIASGASRIGRINFRGFGAVSDVSEGGDNAALYAQAIPEPALLITAAVSLFMLWSAWRRS